MDMNTRIQAMLGTGSASPLQASGSPQAGPAAGGSVTPSVNAIATNGKLTTQNISLLAQTLQEVRDELGT